MIRLSIQTRQGLSRLTLPSLMLLSCGLMILGAVDKSMAAWLRSAVTDRLAPVYSLLHRPITAVVELPGEIRALDDLAAQNRQLRTENNNLRRWYQAAISLAAENQALKVNLHWLPDPAPSFVTTPAVADAGGIYGRAVLLAAGTDQGLRKGEVALDAEGLVGRVTELGARSARVLLITDATSRVPVMLDSSHASAIIVGSNAPAPRLMYYQNDIHPEEGERVVTSSEANAYPAGLPVGTVHYLPSGEPVVVPAAHLDHVDLLRIFDYGLATITPPDAPGHVPSGGRAAPNGPSRSGPSLPQGPVLPQAPGTTPMVGRG